MTGCGIVGMRVVYGWMRRCGGVMHPCEGVCVYLPRAGVVSRSRGARCRCGASLRSGAGVTEAAGWCAPTEGVRVRCGDVLVCGAAGGVWRWGADVSEHFPGSFKQEDGHVHAIYSTLVSVFRNG